MPKFDTNKRIWFTTTQKQVGVQNDFVGWRDTPRTFAQDISLINSEVSEMTEGMRRNLMDTKLKQYPMAVVEAIDVLVRCFDYLDKNNVVWDDMLGVKFIDVHLNDEAEVTANMMMLLSEAWLHNGGSLSHYQIQRCAVLAYDYVVAKGYDPEQITEEKMYYNLTRPDHQRENRKGEPGQKAW